MPVCAVIISFNVIANENLANIIAFSKATEITVNGCLGNGGIFLVDFCKDILHRWMYLKRFNSIQNKPALQRIF
jgi:hypothetical protein